MAVTMQDFEAIFKNGNTEVVVVMSSGDERKLRLFESTNNHLCYKAPGRRGSGYALKYLLGEISSIKRIVSSRNNLCGFDRHLDSLAKYKNAFTKLVHPNLWSSLQDGYKRLDIDAYSLFAKTNGYVEKGDYWDALCKFAQLNQLDLITENHWKTTTVKSNKPKRSGWGQYSACLINIQDYLNNKKDFSYYWEGSYDVHIEGKNGSDNMYRAFFSLEYRGTGNGHYYALINENTAVFLEDD